MKPRVWWYWKGDNPDPNVVAFMSKNYPSDWTYADFASHFHAELYGKDDRLQFNISTNGKPHFY